MIDGTMIRGARNARGWSQARLISAMRTRAVQDGVQLIAPESLRVMLSRWENGHHDPDTFHAGLLAKVLELSTDPTAAVTSVTATAGGPADDTLYGVLLHHTNSLRLLDRRFGAPMARAQTASHVAGLEVLWQKNSGADRSTIARVHSDTACLAAWQDFDVGDFATAAGHYAIARTAASRAGDSVLLAHSIGEQSVMLAETGHALQALRDVSQAEHYPGLPPLLRSWLSATKAQVATYCPNESATVRNALRAAESALADVRPGDEVELPFLSHDQVHLARWTGHVLVHLGDPAAGGITREAMRELPEDFVRAQCAQQLDLAQDAVNALRLDEADALLAGETDRIEVLGSGRLRRRHKLLAGRVRPLSAAVWGSAASIATAVPVPSSSPLASSSVVLLSGTHIN